MTSVLGLDFDGTLVGCRRRQLSALAEVARAEEAAFDDSALREFWEFKLEGASTREALLLLGHDDVWATRVAAAWVSVVEQERFLMLDELLPGTVKTLDELSSRGYVPRVLTARTHPDRALRQVDRLLADHVDSTHVVSPRAAPEGKGRWLKAWSAAAFVGDTEADASAARAEGIPFYAVCSGQRSQKYLLAWGLRVFADLEEVARALP